MSKNIKDVLLIGLDGAMYYFIKKLSDEGLLPNISRLIEEGVFGEALPCPPTDTPTNWTTIATGASTGMHGVTSFYIHIPGEPFELGQKLRSRGQLTRYCKAEYIWNTADKYGIPSLVLNYPAGWPSRMKNGYVCLYSWPMPESTPRVIAEPREYIFRLSREDISSSFTLEINSDLIEKPYYLKIQITGRDIEDYKLVIHCNGKKYGLKIGEWSDWIEVKMSIRPRKDMRIPIREGLVKCLFKLKLLDISDRYLRILRSSVLTVEGWMDPTGIEEELIRKTHYMMEEDFYTKSSERLEYDIFGEEAEHLIRSRVEAYRLAQMANYLKNRIGWRLCLLHYHLMDSVNHRFLGYLDPNFPFYDEEKADLAWKYMTEAYRIVDEFVGLLVHSCTTSDTLIILVSDHAAVPAWRVVNIRKILVDEGLLSYRRVNDHYLVDWSRTYVFPWIEPLMMWINMKNRDPQGIVESEDYESIREQVIDILQGLKDPDTNERITTVTITREESVNIGMGDERTGDVVYFLRPPYTIWHGPLEDILTYKATDKHLKEDWVVKSQSRITGIHGYYLPNVKVGSFSNSSILIMKGPGIKKGEKLKKPVYLMDIAPTISHLLGIPAPSHSQGRILYETLE